MENKYFFIIEIIVMLFSFLDSLNVIYFWIFIKLEICFF